MTILDGITDDGGSKEAPESFFEIGEGLSNNVQYRSVMKPLIKALIEVYEGGNSNSRSPFPAVYYEIAEEFGCEVDDISESRRGPDAIAALVYALGYYAPQIFEKVPHPLDMRETPSGWVPVLERGSGVVAAGALGEGFEDIDRFYLVYETNSMFSRADITVYIKGRDNCDKADEILSILVDQIWKHSPYRGRTIYLGHEDGEVTVDKMDELVSDRNKVILPDEVWNKVSANLRILGETGERMEAAGMRTHRGLLLQGPPGMGKTTLVRQLAAESNQEYGATVLIPSASAARYVLQDIMEIASHHLPAVVVLEDVDSISGDRGDTILSDYLSIIDGVSANHRILTLSTTNDSSAIDPAVLRPGRIDDVVEISPPTRENSMLILVNLLERFLPDVEGETLLAAAQNKVGEDETLGGAALESLVGTLALHQVTTTREALHVIESFWDPIHVTKSYLR